MKIDNKNKSCKCTVCGKHLASRSNLYRHMRIHTGEKPYGCNQCDRKFIQSNDLKKHMKLHMSDKPFKHKYIAKDEDAVPRSATLKTIPLKKTTSIVTKEDDNQTYYCNICLKQFSSETFLINHLKTHGNKRGYKCHLCDKFFTHSGNLKRHIRIHTSNQPFNCKDCDKQFIRSSDLMNHSLLHIAEKKTFSNVQDTDLTKTDDESVENLEPMNHDNISDDDRGFKEPASKTTVIKTETEMSENDESVNINGTILNGTRNPNVCHICFKQYSNSGNLTRHIKTHSGVKPYECKQCGKDFTQSNDLKRHLQKHAIRKNSSMHHMKLKSKDVIKRDVDDDDVDNNSKDVDKMHVCNVCSKQFSYKSNFLAHMRMHAADKPFTCNVCGWQFSRNNNLIQHLRLVHSIVDLSEYEDATKNDTPPSPDTTNTNENEFKYYNGNDLKSNSSTHTCNICNKTYSTIGNLSRHKKIHGGAKPFRFKKDMQKLTKNNSSIQNVKQGGAKLSNLTHNKEALDMPGTNRRSGPTMDSRYQCHICSQHFNTSLELNEHKKTHGETLSPEGKENSFSRHKHLCSVCHKHFSTSGNLTRHMKIHTGEKPYKCMQCDRQFTQGNDLKRHLERHWKEQPHDKEKVNDETNMTVYQDVSGEIMDDIIIVNNSHVCDLCAEHFSTEVHLNEHLKIQHDLNVDYSQLIKDYNLKEYDLPTMEIPFIYKADQIQPKSTELSAISVTGERRSDVVGHVCDICDKKFSTHSNLTRHMKIHLGMQSYSNKNYDEFNQDDNLQQQPNYDFVERTDENMTCSSILDEENLIQTNSFVDSEYQCTEEEIIVVNASEICNVCFEHFPDTVKLEEHMKIHTTSSVTKCDDQERNGATSPRKNLLSPEETKTHEEPIESTSKEKRPLSNKKANVCTICFKQFSTRCNVIRHMKIHAGIKPYKCKECGRQFTQGNDLKRHMKRHLQDNNINNKDINSSSSSSSSLIIKDEPLDFKEDIVVVNISHICHVCSEHLPTETDLQNHLKVHDSSQQTTVSSDIDTVGSQIVDEGLKNMDAENIQEPTKDSDSKSQSDEQIVIYSGKKRYPCPTCGRFFSTPGNLTRHIKIHTGIKPYRCKFCSRQFIQGNDLKRHMKKHSKENRNQNMTTPVTSSSKIGLHSLGVLTEETGRNQEDTIVNNSHTCHICSEIFTCEIDLNNHVAIHPSQIKNKGNMKREVNIKRVKSEEVYSKPENPNSTLPLAKQKVGTKFQSRVVRKTFVKSRYRCELCGKYFSTSGNLSRHKKIHFGVKPYKCEECGKLFTQGSDLKKHLKRHIVKPNENINESSQNVTNDIPQDCKDDIVFDNTRHKCDVCTAHFPTEIELKNHIKIHIILPTNNKTIESVTNSNSKQNKNIFALSKVTANHQTDKLLKTNKQVDDLIGTTGEELIIHKCNICDKTFSTDGNLKRHKKIHMGLKPFKCKHCGKQYTQSSDLTRHMRLHVHEKQILNKKAKSNINSKHLPTTTNAVGSPNKKNICTVCNKQFSTDGNLKRHMKNHAHMKSYKNKESKDKQTDNDKIDRVIDTGVNDVGEHGSAKDTVAANHACKICKKLYSTSSNLIRHMKIHSGEKPYKCRQCGRHFTQSNDLKRHTRTHCSAGM